MSLDPIRALSACAAIATALLAGCSQKADTPLNYYEVRLEGTATNQADCRGQVLVQLEPLKIQPETANSLYETKGYVDRPELVGKPVLDGPGNWECWFTYRSRDLAPGTWRISAVFPSPISAESTGITQSCERQVIPGRTGHVRIDQEDGCVEFATAGTETVARR